MRVDTNLFIDDIAPAMRWLGNAFGRALDKRVEGFAQQEQRNPLMGSHLRATFPIENALSMARKHFRTTGRYPLDREYDRAYTFVSALQRVLTALPDLAASHLLNRVRGALKDDFGLRPVAYELDTAVHLNRRGFDVEWADLIGSERFDLRATKGAASIEIECKTTSPDTGRKITRTGLNRIAGSLSEKSRIIVRTGGAHLFRVAIPGRLDTNDKQIAEIASLILEAMDRTSNATAPGGTVTYMPLDSTALDLNEEPEIRKFLDSKLERPNCHVLWHALPGHGLVAVALMSDEPDTVAASVTAQALKGANQCSGKNPAIVALQLVEMSRAQLEILLKTPNALHAAARRVFKKSYVDSIAYSVPVGSEIVARAGSHELSAPVLVLNNPAPLYPCTLAREIFSGSA